MQDNLLSNMEVDDGEKCNIISGIFLKMKENDKKLYGLFNEKLENVECKMKDVKVLEVEDINCCGCTTQERNLSLAALFLIFASTTISMLEFNANTLDVGSRNHKITAYSRVVFTVLCLVRFVSIANLILLVGTVKRNAIYIYPFLVNYQLLTIVLNITSICMEAVIMYLGRNGTRMATSVEATISGVNIVICCYCLLVIYYQYNNGWNCGRNIEGEERDTFIEGEGPMKIAENNRGPITPYIEDHLFLEFSLV